MIVQVDLSAKIEQWSKDTAVALSNGIQGSILVDRRVKKAARDWLQDRYPDRIPSFYMYMVCAVLIYLLVRPELDQISHLEIDQDYPGTRSEDLIKNFLLNFLHRDDPSLRGGFISFRKVKGSRADILARRTFVGKEAADRAISLDEIKAAFN